MIEKVNADVKETDFGWQRSSFCASNGCVEVAIESGKIMVRDGKLENGPILTFDAQEWQAFIGGVKAAEFDI